MSGCFLHTSIKYDLEMFSLLSANGFNISNIIFKKSSNGKKMRNRNIILQEPSRVYLAALPYLLLKLFFETSG